MDLLKNNLTKVFLLLLLAGNTSLFSANAASAEYSFTEDQQEPFALVSEEFSDLFEFILPIQKDLLFAKASPFISGVAEGSIKDPGVLSLHYIKHSRFILPSLGVRELIFPFHVFF